jgi:hypothetical protein
MTKRKWNLPLLCASGSPVKWLRYIVSNVNQAVENAFASQWQTVRIARRTPPVDAHRRTREF